MKKLMLKQTKRVTVWAEIGKRDIVLHRKEKYKTGVWEYEAKIPKYYIKKIHAEITNEKN